MQDLVARFRAALPHTEPDAWIATLQRAHADFCVANPSLHFPFERLVQRAVDAAKDEADPERALRELALTDLLYVCALEAGCTDASAHLIETLRRAVASARVAQGVGKDDVISAMVEKLLVARDGTAFGIGKYSGRGSLEGWLRIVATRTALNAQRARGAEEKREERTLTEMLGLERSPELSFLQEEQRKVLTAAAARAIASLSPDERDALRMSVYDGLSIDDIGRILDVHRSTVARWLVAVRERLRVDVEKALREGQGLSDSEVASMMNLALSQLDISVKRLLIPAK
jgi:RNA polymerase sigma-70 factor, ECF subfamily